MENEALTLQLENLKSSCRQVIGFSPTYLSRNLKVLSALSEAVFVRDYLQALFDDWRKELPFIGDSNFITCKWEMEKEEIEELAEKIEENWGAFYSKKWAKYDVPSLNSFPSAGSESPAFSDCFSWVSRNDNDRKYELFGYPDHWKKMASEAYPSCERNVNWHVAKEIKHYFRPENRMGSHGENFDERQVLVSESVAQSIVSMGYEDFPTDIESSILPEVLYKIANLLDKIYRLLTQPRTIIGNKYLLEDAFAAFFKRIYMEYALDKGMYRTHEAEFEAYRAAYVREDRYMDFYPWISGKCWNDFNLSGFLQPYSRDRGENIEELSRFNEIFPAPQYFCGDNYSWSLHANAGRYIYYYQLREDGWLDKTNSFLSFLMLIDLYRGEEHLKFKNAETGCLEKSVTPKILEKGMLHPFQQCLQRIHIFIEEDKERVRRKEREAWQNGDWRHVFEICKEKKLVKDERNNFAEAIAEAIMQPEKAHGIRTTLSQTSDNSTRREPDRERDKRICRKIEEILSPITDRVTEE